MLTQCIRTNISSLNNTSNREKCSSSQFILSKISYHFFSSMLIFSNNILYACAKSSLYSSLILLWSRDYVSNNTDNLRVLSFSLHYLLDTLAVTFISFSKISKTLISRLQTYNCLVIFLHFRLNSCSSIRYRSKFRLCLSKLCSILLKRFIYSTEFLFESSLLRLSL